MSETRKPNCHFRQPNIQRGALRIHFAGGFTRFKLMATKNPFSDLLIALPIAVAINIIYYISFKERINK